MARAGGWGSGRSWVRSGARSCLAANVFGAAVLPVAVSLSPPDRNFGYFIGDTVTVAAQIAAPPGFAPDPETLPQSGPVSPDLDITHVSVRHGPAGWTIAVQYQNFLGAEIAGAQNTVPPYSLELKGPQGRATVTVPRWAFLVAPLRNEIAPAIAASSMRPDHPLPRPGVGNLRVRLTASLCAAAAAAAVLIGLRFGWRLRPARAPFSAAIRQLRAALQGRRARDAYVILHRAFDATAGRAVLAEDVEAFLSVHERFRLLRPEIERFYADSRNVFFGREEDAPDLSWLDGFGRRLSRAERG